MKRKTNVLFVGHDRGGCDAIIPVLKKLSLVRSVSTFGVFSSIAKDIVPKKAGVRCVNLKTFHRRDLELVFDAVQPMLVVVGTSGGVSLDKLAVVIARERGIPSVAILDFLGNYRYCFSPSGGKVLAYIPTWIFTINQASKLDLIAEGIPAERIRVTGNPGFESFKPLPASSEAPPLISFFHQPFSELEEEHAFGYDERVVLSDIIAVLEKLVVTERIVIKMHPRTKRIGVYDAIIHKSGLNIGIDKRSTSRELISKSKVVLGMNSTALFEAALSGRPVVSYQPGLRKKDPLISNILGLSYSVYQKKDLLNAIQRALSGKVPRSASNIRKRHTFDTATRDVVQTLHTLNLL